MQKMPVVSRLYENQVFVGRTFLEQNASNAGALLPFMYVVAEFL